MFLWNLNWARQLFKSNEVISSLRIEDVPPKHLLLLIQPNFMLRTVVAQQLIQNNSA